MGGDAEIEEGSLASLGMNGGELVEGDLTGRDPLYCAPAEMRWRSGRNDKFSPKSVPKGPTHRDGVWGTREIESKSERRKVKFGRARILQRLVDLPSAFMWVKAAASRRTPYDAGGGSGSVIRF
jgi:hypothetical protein